MDRREAIQKIEAIIDNGQDYGYWTDAQRKALELAIDALKEPTGDYEFFGGTYAKEGDAESATTTDCISRADAIEEIALHDCTNGEVPYFTGKGVQEILNILPPVTPKEQTDCTDFINWLLEEVLDEENWELNAVADGEIICRKLKKLGLLEVKDGYYVRASVTPKERTGEWIDQSNGGAIVSAWYESHKCNKCGSYGSKAWDYCPNCGAKMGGDTE